MTYAFSDGSPFAELAALGVTFLVFVGATKIIRQTRASESLDRGLDAIAGFLRRRLFVVDDPQTEQQRLDLLRIILASMAFLRNAANLATALQLGEATVIAATGAATALSFLLIVGFAVPLTAAVFCVTLNTILDNIARTSSLSSLVMSMALIPLALAPAGRSLSLDAMIMRRTGGMSRLWGSFYRSWGHFTLNRAAWSKLLLLLTYAGISFSSGLLHLQFEVWHRGLTNSWMFLNPVADPYLHETVARIYQFSPRLYVFLTRCSAYGTLLFQLAMVPLLFLNRWTRALVVALELGFVLGSVSLLALKWLGWNQLVVWALLFWNRWKLNIAGKDCLETLYDDRCNLCDRTMRVLRAVDLFKVLQFRPLSQNIDFANSHGISHASALEDLYCVDDQGRVMGGYEFYLTVTGRIFLLIPFWPALWLGKVTRLGPVMYRYIAARRIALSGVCQRMPLVNRPRAPADIAVRPSYNALFCGTVGAFAVMLAAYCCRLPIPYVPGSAKAAELSKQVFGQAPVAFGFWQINAFNFGLFQGQGFAGELTWSKSGEDRRQPVMWLPPVRASIPVSDILFYQLVVQWNRVQYDGPCFTSQSLQNLLDQPGLQAVLRQRPFSGGDFHVKLRTYTTPVLEDFLRGRYVPLVWRDLCEATFPAGSLAPFAFKTLLPP